MIFILGSPQAAWQQTIIRIHNSIFNICGLIGCIIAFSESVINFYTHKKCQKCNQENNGKNKFISSVNRFHNTIGYIAPEVLRNQPYNQKIDIYSIGVILYTLFTGSLPFAGNSTLEIYQNNLQANVNTSQLEQINITEKAKQFVFSLLSENPDKRPTAQEALRHQWFRLPPSLTNNLILSTQTNLSGHKKHQKFLSIKCTSPLWYKSKMKDCLFEDSDDSIYNEKIQVVKDSIVFNDEDDAELMDEVENQTNQIQLSARQCEKYYFSNTKIRLLNEKRDQGLF